MSQIIQHPNLLSAPGIRGLRSFYTPMLFLLWGLTPIVSSIVGRELLPTYDYFRIYRQGDVCRVHFDRLSCEQPVADARLQ